MTEKEFIQKISDLDKELKTLEISIRNFPFNKTNLLLKESKKANHEKNCIPPFEL